MYKILFMIPNLEHGGAEKVLVNLVNNLDREKFDVTVQTLFDVGVNRQYLKPHVHYKGGGKWQFRGNSHLLKLFSPKKLYKHFIREKYDIVVSYLEGPTARIISGCDDEKTKKVCWLHIEMNSPKIASVGFPTVKSALSAYDNYDCLIAVSGRVKEVFLSSMKTRSQVKVLYNTNETELICKKALDGELDTRFITDDIPNICSVAKIVHTKGFDRLLNVHKRLLDEGIMHKVYILGVGELQNELERKIAEYGVQDSFILLGFQDNPYKYVSRCDLYVCSSRREGFSTAVTEALVVGTPVVSTDCSGARELLGENDEYGIVVENSEEGVYSGMKRMLCDPELLKHYKEQAVERGKFFSREKTVKAAEDMFEEMMNAYGRY